MTRVNDDEFRVEVELNDVGHGYSVGERLRALDLGDDARDKLSRHVIVTRDGSKLFLYANDERLAREAERVVRDLVAQDELTAEITVTRWHPVEEAWKDASLPMPRTDEEREAEYARREEAEAQEVEDKGAFDWHVHADVPTRAEAIELAERLAEEGVDVVSRRWRYVVLGALTEERAHELADRVRAEAPEGTDVWVGVNPRDLPRALFVPFFS